MPAREQASAKKEEQLHGRLTIDESAQFMAYSRACGLLPSALASLLIVRELTLKRLPELRTTLPTIARGATRVKVTARMEYEGRKKAFVAHADALKIKPTAAVALVFRAELVERWLERSLHGK